MKRSEQKWPKDIIKLTSEEKKKIEQMYVDAQKWGYSGIFGWIQKLGHKYVEKISSHNRKSNNAPLTLEIGCGSGVHFRYASGGYYIGMDIRSTLLQKACERYSEFSVVNGDGYKMPFRDSSFDRVVSVYVFEHLNRLPDCLKEIRRVLKDDGELLVSIPAEGGLAVELGRKMTSKKYFERKYDVDYLRLVKSEHCNTCREVIEEISNWFKIDITKYLPFCMPSIHINAIVVMRCLQLKP